MGVKLTYFKKAEIKQILCKGFSPFSTGALFSQYKNMSLPFYGGEKGGC